MSIEEWRPADGWIRRTPTAGTCRWGSVRVPHRSWIGAPASAIPPLGRNAFALGVPVEAYKDMSRHVRAIVDVHRWYRYFNASSEPCGRLALQELTDGLFVRSDERLLGRWLSRYVQDLTKVSRYVRPVDIGGVRKPETDYRELWHIVLTDLLAYLPGQPLALPVNEATRARRARPRRLEAPMAPNEVLNLRRELERRSTPAHREKNRLQKRAQRQRLKESGA